VTLSASKIRDLLVSAPGKKHDADGLILDIRSPTSASWVFKFTFAGKRDEMGLGKLQAKDRSDRDAQIMALQAELDEVRARAKFCRDEIAAGRNPKDTKKAIKLEAVRVAMRPKSDTVHGLIKKHFTDINGGKVNREEGVEAWIDSLQESRIGRIANMQPEDVTMEDVLEMWRAYSPRAPWQASFVLYRLERVLQWAHSVGLIQKEGWTNPARHEGNLEFHGVILPKTSDSEHYASVPHQEVGRFLANMRELEGNTKAALACMEWQILSGSRPNEAEGADWSEINLVLKAWVIPAERMKMKKQHRVPLTDRHVEILEAMLPANGEMPTSGLIFPGEGGGKLNRAGRQKMLRKLCDKTLHGFRSSFSTWAHGQMRTVMDMETGEKSLKRRWDFDVVEACIAHVSGSASSRVYNGEDYLEGRRGIMAAWAAYCAIVQERATVHTLGKLRQVA
jgi:integrase